MIWRFAVLLSIIGLSGLVAPAHASSSGGTTMTARKSTVSSGLCACRDTDCKILYGTCHCGCGGATSISTHTSKNALYGRPQMYVYGHRFYKAPPVFPRKCVKCGTSESSRWCRNMCKKCYDDVYQKANRVKANENSLKWYFAHTDKVKQDVGVRRLKSPLHTNLICRKSFAKKHGIPFDIVAQDLNPLPTHCPVLGIKLNYRAKRRADNSPSLDRVIPALGYVRGNVKIICSRANRIKTDSTIEETRAVLRYMEKNARGL